MAWSNPHSIYSIAWNNPNIANAQRGQMEHICPVARMWWCLVNWRWNSSTIPSVMELYAMVQVYLIPSCWVKAFHRCDWNNSSRSVVMVEGIPNRDTHVRTSALATVSVQPSATLKEDLKCTASDMSMALAFTSLERYLSNIPRPSKLRHTLQEHYENFMLHTYSTINTL